MTQRKIVFFDIDGTLVMLGEQMPASTLAALRKARENGHRLVICTGRIRDDIPKSVDPSLFDGFVCASGGYVEWQQQVLQHRTWNAEEVNRFITFARENGILFHFQCYGHKYVIDTQYDAIRQIWESKFQTQSAAPETFGAVAVAEQELRGAANVEKALYHATPFGLQEMQARLSELFEVTGSSFDTADAGSGEITQKNVTKAAGMKLLLTYLKVDPKDSIAYGDGPNDFDMLAYAGIGVAMGNAGEALKQKADRVTSSIREDGISKSMEQLGLL